MMITDDQEISREGLRAMLTTEPGIAVVGEAASGEEALEKVGQLKPNVVLMDLRLPGANGIAVTRLLKEKHPEVAVLILSVYGNEGYVVDAAKAGAAGYLLKDVSRELLCHAIRAVSLGGAFIKGNILDTARPFVPLAGLGRRTADGYNPVGLSPREMEVLALLVEGNANKEIARALSIAEETVKKHVQRVMAKLGVLDRTQAAVKAVRDGLVH